MKRTVILAATLATFLSSLAPLAASEAAGAPGGSGGGFLGFPEGKTRKIGFIFWRVGICQVGLFFFPGTPSLNLSWQSVTHIFSV